VAVTGDLRAEVEAGGQAVNFVGREGERVLRYDKLAAWEADKKPLRAWMEAEGRELRLAVDDTGAAYPLTIDPMLSQQAKLTASDGAASDLFGLSVAVGGETAVVGADSDDVGANENQGSAYFFVQTFTVLQGAQFNDVPTTHIFYEFIGKLAARGVTAGCGGATTAPTRTSRARRWRSSSSALWASSSRRRGLPRRPSRTCRPRR
jgi:hypothetical protein